MIIEQYCSICCFNLFPSSFTDLEIRSDNDLGDLRSSMSGSASSVPGSGLVSEPIPISLVAGRYLLFDIDVVTYLRRTHRICGTPIGTIPRSPQQNVFSGLPMELMPEEARMLFEKGAAYIVDDHAWHKEDFATDGPHRSQYMDALQSVGLRACKAAEKELQMRKELALGKQAALGARKASSDPTDTPQTGEEDHESLFNAERPLSRVSNRSTSNTPWAVTPTTSHISSSPHKLKHQTDVSVPSSYPLFAHLHSKGYYMWPGLRFGCNYNVYPGDPMRFHAHFDAVSFEWNEEIDLMHLVGGGRLGTRVKKAFLIGGRDDDQPEESNPVRAFSIEWGGM